MWVTTNTPSGESAQRPGRRDLFELVGRAEPVLDRLLGEARVADAVGPQGPPPFARLGVGVDPGVARYGNVREPPPGRATNRGPMRAS